MNYKYYYYLFFVLLIVSCKPVEKANEINYMQNIEAVAQQAAVNNLTTTLQNGDELMILVSAKDNDVVKPYNKNYSSSEVVNNSIPAAGNMPNTGISSITGPSYIIDSEGDIDFSGIGKIRAAGKTLVDFKEELRNEIKKYVINPTINIRLTNFKVSVLGEVNRPGEYNIVEGQGTILKAISLAGDITLY